MKRKGNTSAGLFKKKKKITNLWLPNYKTPSNHCSIYTLVNMPPDNKEQSQLLLQNEARQKQKPPKKKSYRGKKKHYTVPKLFDTSDRFMSPGKNGMRFNS